MTVWDGSPSLQVDPALRRFETATHTVYWKGLVFKDGLQAGAPSIASFANDLSDVGSAAATLRGIYFVAAREKQTGITYAFGDQTGMLHVFLSKNAISTSFLELAARERLGFSDMTPESITDFLTGGHLIFGQTLFPQITKLKPTEVALVRAGAGISLLPKKVRNLGDTPAFTVEHVFENLASAIRSQQVSVDLTGGVDTRLVAVVLDYFGVPFEVAHAGTKGNLDLEIAEEVAEALGKQLYVTYHDPSDFDSQVPELFKYCDGLLDVTKDHLGLQMQHDRLKRGISVVVTGDGGALHKDGSWLQDFPFYWKKRPNMKRFCAYRVAPNTPRHELLGERFLPAAYSYRERALQHLSEFVVPGNTQSYDQYAFRVKAPDGYGRFASNHVQLIDVYCPLLERDAVVYSYHLPRLKRFFNNFHRACLTRLNPTVARIRTTEGSMSASSEWKSVSADVLLYVANKLSRVEKKLSQRWLNKSYRQESPVHPQFYPTVRTSGAMGSAFRELQQRGVLNSKVRLDDVPNGYLGPILTLHLTLQAIENMQTHRAAS